ncbi:MAG: TIR domain-containing protein [Promethearchaeota archaeon]
MGHDESKFHIPELSSILEQDPLINYAFYFKKYASGSIVEFMNTYLPQSQVVVIFCSKNALKSSFVARERDMAVNENKHIIPIFEDLNDVPQIIRMEMGVPFSFNMSPNVLAQRILDIIHTGKKRRTIISGQSTRMSQDQFENLMFQQGQQALEMKCSVCNMPISNYFGIQSFLSRKQKRTNIMSLGILKEYWGNPICPSCFGKRVGLSKNASQKAVDLVKRKFNVE